MLILCVYAVYSSMAPCLLITLPILISTKFNMPCLLWVSWFVSCFYGVGLGRNLVLGTSRACLMTTVGFLGPSEGEVGMM